MDYPPDAFTALVTEVESQGGALLPEPCQSEDVEYTVPPYHTASIQEGITCSCEAGRRGNETRLVSIYDPALKVRQGGSGFVTACAVCDNMGTWPRYCKAVYAVDPELDPAFHDEEEEGEDAED